MSSTHGVCTAPHSTVKRTFGIVISLAALAAAGQALAASAEWTPAPNMAAARYSPTATVLSGTSTNKNKVLVAGGYNGGACVTSAQLFNPDTNTWSTTGSLKTSRSFATATDLGDGTGRVLVAGGFTSTLYGWSTLKTAEIYNPATGTFAYTARTVNGRTTQVSMNSYRELFTGTRLGNGKILLAGGIYGGQTTVRTAELFDPKAMTFTLTGPMQTPAGRFGHDAVAIPPADPANTSDLGTVLVVGGKEHASDGWHSLQTAELYDVAKGTFTSIPMLYPRDRPRVAWVPNVGTRGMVLVVGGKSESPRDKTAVTGDVLTCEWFDPATNSFKPGPTLQQGRMAHTLTKLADGSLLAAGGWSDTLWRSTETAERFIPNPSDPLFGSFMSSPVTVMADPRQDHDAVALPSPSGSTAMLDRVLVVGGKPNVNGVDSYLNRAEIYTRP